MMDGREQLHGDGSAHAHGAGQKPVNARYRTKLCRNFPLGTCRYGEHCSYLHIISTPSPITQYNPSRHTMSRSSLYSSISPFTTAPFHPHPSTSFRAPNDTRAQPHKDARIRAPRPDGPRRNAPSASAFAAEANSSGPGPGPGATSFASSAGAEVEKWRLAVSADGLFPPAPPATPVSVLNGLPPTPKPPPVSPLTMRAPPSRALDNSASALNGVWGARACEWHGYGESLPVYPLIAPRQLPAAKPVRHRNQFFKTKPCRFYGEPGGCIKGDRCNFIHEHPEEDRSPTGLVAPAAEAVSEGEAESGAESSVQGEAPSTAATSDHTPSVAAASEAKKRNFYPVTWRVVGGGVMMSGQREVCEAFMAGHCSEGADCRFAHPDTSEDDYAAYSEPPPIYSPISPVLSSPVVFAYPWVYPSLSSPQPFALPALPGQVSPSSDSAQASQTPQNGMTHTARPSVSITPAIETPVQPSGLPFPYSPHRVVDGTTLAQCDESTYSDGLHVGRSVVRPVSTPPTPIQGSEAGIARLFAAEMP